MVAITHSEHDLDHTDYDQNIVSNPVSHMIHGEERARDTFEGVTVAVYEGLYDDRLVMVAEIEGAIARDLLDEKNVVPNGDHPFTLNSFPDGITVHDYHPNADHVTEDFDSIEDIPFDFIYDAMEAQAQTNADLAEQYVELYEDDLRGEDEPPIYEDWPDPRAYPRRLLRNRDMPVVRERDGVTYFQYNEKDGDHLGAVEIPSAGIREVYDLGYDWGRTPSTRSTRNETHWQWFCYDEGVTGEEVDNHLYVLAGRIASLARSFALRVDEEELPAGYPFDPRGE